ncbi:MAG: nicotinamide-nucleotide adenylyltransferase [Desulfurococcaceae archaeon]
MTKRCLMIARFQPLHYGHLHALEYAFSISNEVVVAVGMASQSHTPENPFTAGERIEMIRRALKWRNYDLSRVITVTIPTMEVSRVAVHYVKLYSPEFHTVLTLNPIIKQLFIEEGYDVVEPSIRDRTKFTGSEVRRLMAMGDPHWKELVPPPVAEYIEEIRGVERVKMLYREHIPGYYATV